MQLMAGNGDERKRVLKNTPAAGISKLVLEKTMPCYDD